MKLKRYRTPPNEVFRQMGLGVIKDGRIKVVAGFRYRWWDPEGSFAPLIVEARILRIKPAGDEVRK